MAPDYFAKFHNAKEDIMRFTSYTPPDFPLIENDMGAGAHSDFGSLTLLFQDDVGGLQVLSNGEWLDAKPIPDTILYPFPAHPLPSVWVLIIQGERRRCNAILDFSNPQIDKTPRHSSLQTTILLSLLRCRRSRNCTSLLPCHECC